MRILHIKIEHNGQMEYKVTSKKGCCYKHLMPIATKLMLREYLELDHCEPENIKISTLEQKLQRTEEALRVAREAVEFYGDDSNYYETWEYSGHFVIIKESDVVRDYFDEGLSCGGKKARESLKQIDEILGEKDESHS